MFGHAKVAAAIAELPATERGGKCIGLSGSWGSGKSSVVEILRHKLRQLHAGNIDIFVFDAWAHQGEEIKKAVERLAQLAGVDVEKSKARRRAAETHAEPGRE